MFLPWNNNFCMVVITHSWKEKGWPRCYTHSHPLCRLDALWPIPVLSVALGVPGRWGTVISCKNSSQVAGMSTRVVWVTSHIILTRSCGLCMLQSWIEMEYYSVAYFEGITEFDMLKWWASAKGGPQTGYVNVWLSDIPMKHVWALPLAEAQHYGVSKSAMHLKIHNGIRPIGRGGLRGFTRTPHFGLQTPPSPTICKWYIIYILPWAT